MAQFNRSTISCYLFVLIVIKFAYSSEHFTNQFVVEVPGGIDEAIQVAKDHDFDFLGKVGKYFIYLWCFNLVVWSSSGILHLRL